MLGQPGCPNLYWALTSLPVPMISLRTGIEGERTGVLAEFRDLDHTRPMSAVQVGKFVAHIDVLLNEDPATRLEKGVRRWLETRVKDEAKMAAARRRLVESGLSEERVRRFPAEQVLLLDEWREYEVRCDDVMKLLSLPFRQAEAALEEQARVKRPPTLFAEALMPSTKAVRRAQARLDQRIGLLRHVEALRLYAAGHGGRLPVKLAEVPVPLPDDPVTGKPFRYELSGATAHVRGTPPAGDEKNPFFNVHYVLTVRK